jgi:hypothetical protein
MYMNSTVRNIGQKKYRSEEKNENYKIQKKEEKNDEKSKQCRFIKIRISA